MLFWNFQIHNDENYVKKNKISSLVGDLTFVRGTYMVLMLVI